MAYDKSSLAHLLQGLPARERQDFHNPLVAFLGLAGRRMPALPTKEEVQSLVTCSKQLSPGSDPAAWLVFVRDSWAKGPMLQPASYAPEALLATAAQANEANLSYADKALLAGFTQHWNGVEGVARVPTFVCQVLDDVEEASQRLTAYHQAHSGTNTAVLKLGGAQDGQCLALGYLNEDTTTSQVFQALKFMGYALDDQAEAQLVAFDKYQEGLGTLAASLASRIPFTGLAVPIPQLLALHASPHRYDQEALENDGPDVGLD